MDRIGILKRLDEERRQLARDGEFLESRHGVTRLRGSDGSYHLVIYASPSPDEADARIVAEVEHHRLLGVSFEWKVFGHDTPADLVRKLEHHGFAIGPCESVLVYDLSERPEWVDGRTRHPQNRVARVDTLAQLAVYRAVAEETFSEDHGETAGRLANAILTGSAQHRAYVAYAGDRPAAVARLYTHPSSAFAGLYGGGTLPAYRGRGLYRATVAARAGDAMALGSRYLMVDALPTSRPILERLGFQWLTDTWPCVWTR